MSIDHGPFPVDSPTVGLGARPASERRYDVSGPTWPRGVLTGTVRRALGEVDVVTQNMHAEGAYFDVDDASTMPNGPLRPAAFVSEGSAQVEPS